MKYPALLAFAASASLFLLAAPERARAECLPDPAMFGDPVDCLADDPDGFASDADGLQVWVDMGVTVSNDAGPAISVPGFGNLVINDGNIASTTGDGVVVGDFPSPGVENFGSITAAANGVVVGEFGMVTNEGSIDAGLVGVVAGLDAIVVNSGHIGGGVASMQFGDGFDALQMMGGSSLNGDVVFGGGDDLLTFDANQLARPAGLSVFYGGADDDMVDFSGLDMSALLALSLLPSRGQDGLALELATGGASGTLLLFAEFETFVFADPSGGAMPLSVDDMVAKGLPAAVVPVPAALPLLVSALGLGGLLFRRRDRPSLTVIAAGGSGPRGVSPAPLPQPAERRFTQAARVSLRATS